MSEEMKLQKAAERYCIKTHELDGTYSCQICGGKQQSAFIAGAKHQDAISRRDERVRLITLFQDKRDLLDTNSREWEILKNIIKQVVEETK